MQVESERPTTILDRYPNPFFGGFQSSNVVEATIIKVHTDEANNVTLTADVTTIKGEQKRRVPFALPFANATGTAGIFAVPNIGDKCLVVMTAGNSPYIFAYHASVQQEQARSSAAIATSPPGPALKGTFAKSQLIPGCIELRSPGQNRVLLHPGGSIAIDAKVDLFTFYDAVSSTIESLSRNLDIFTAGGSILWEEGGEKSQVSHSFFAELFTKSATKENTDKGFLRGGARMEILFNENANHFFLEILDENNIKSQIQIGPNGIILTSGNGTTKTSIAISPTGNFALIAGDPMGIHTQLDLAPTAIAITAFDAAAPLATLQANGDGAVNISSEAQTNIESFGNVKITGTDGVSIVGTSVALGALGGLGVVREFQDEILIFGLVDEGTASGFAIGGSAIVTAAG